MRTPPIAAPEALELTSNGMITETRTYSVITPLFGGGVTPGEADPITTVRASEVRGQLRFWWRATRGGQFGGDLLKMRAAEEALWGGPAREENGKTVGGQSEVRLALEIEKRGTEDYPFEVKRKGRGWKSEPRPQWKDIAYAAFPLQPSDAELQRWHEGTRPRPFVVGVSFTLTMTFPVSERTDVEAALWAWETFGGIGARSRRGFGALRLRSIDGKPSTDLPDAQPERARRWIESKLRQYLMLQQGWPEHVPHLSQDLRLKIVQKAQAKPQDEWAALIRALKQFRQKRSNKETGRNDLFGHSDWPEPNAIRGIFHKPLRGYYATRNIVAFPRAQFGLPIVFHMAHDADIPDLDLQGGDKHQRRLASPLVLKPLACLDNKAVGIVFVFEGVRLPEHLILANGPKDAEGNDPPVESYLSSQDAENIPPLDGKTDVLQAFLDTL